MEYLYCKNENFEDYSSGRVLHGGKGIPNFPVRLINEILVDWNDGESDSLDLMLEQLANTSTKRWYLLFQWTKKQKINSKTWDVLEKSEK